MKVGVLVTSSFSAEVTKNEFVKVGARGRPWLRDTPAHLQFDYIDKQGRTSKAVTSDAAIISYLLWKYPATKLIVEAIFPHQLTVRKAKTFDLVFIPMCDQLEVNTILPRKAQARFQRLIKSIPNIFPSYNVQRLINRKDLYYRYLQKYRIPMIDTLPILKSDVRENGHRIYLIVRRIRAYAKRKKWERMVIKPISGQEGLMFQALPQDVDDDRLANAVEEILKLYDGVLVQEYIPGFDKHMLETRIYNINEKYAYTILTNDSAQPKLLQSQGGTVKIPNIKQAMTLSRRVQASIPKNRVNGVVLPHWLIRTDIGYFPKANRPFLVYICPTVQNQYCLRSYLEMVLFVLHNNI